MDNSTGKAIVGFVFGAAIGVAAGILFAPRSGAETRKRIEKKAREYSDDISKKVGDKIEDLKGYVDEVAKDAKAHMKKTVKEETKA